MGSRYSTRSSVTVASTSRPLTMLLKGSVVSVKRAPSKSIFNLRVVPFQDWMLDCAIAITSVSPATVYVPLYAIIDEKRAARSASVGVGPAGDLRF